MVYEGDTHTRSLGKIWCKLGGQDETKDSTCEAAEAGNEDLFDIGGKENTCLNSEELAIEESSKDHT